MPSNHSLVSLSQLENAVESHRCLRLGGEWLDGVYPPPHITCVSYGEEDTVTTADALRLLRLLQTLLSRSEKEK